MQVYSEAKLQAVKPWFIQSRPVDSYVENGHYPLMRRFAYKSDCEQFILRQEISGVWCAFDEDSMIEERDDRD